MNINEMSDEVLTFTELVAAEQADLRQRIAELERHNKLLRAVAEAAKVFGNKTVLFPGYYTISFQHGHNLLLATKAAIDGGALETAYTEGFEAGKKANGG